jgi:hypothetical protein
MTNQSQHKVWNLLTKWPTAAVLASDLGLKSRTHVACFKVRGRIPRAYWHDLVAAAEKRGIEGVTLDELKKIHEGVGQRRS